MKKILLIFFFFILNSKTLYSSEETSNKKLSGCNNEVSKDYFVNADKTIIKKIEIDINKYKNWTINNIKILTTRGRFISHDLKRNFKANVRVIYENDIICNFKARVRHSGDAKDHIELKGNSVIQSLDVKLIDGNIRGITRFKLFKPGTRGNIDDVVIVSQLLRNLNYLAPRSIKVNAKINETESLMLFQEKASKELLEFNNRREGPILEGDEKFFFKGLESIPDNQLSNWAQGVPFIQQKTSKVMLSKITNANFTIRSAQHKQISLDALNYLNLIYLYWSNRFDDEKNNYFFFDYDLDNTLLALFKDDHIQKLETYNLFLQATNSHHALSATNRKFYWNSIENYFEPILYDSNSEIDKNFSTTTTKDFRIPISSNLNKSFQNLESELFNINIGKLKNNLDIDGLNLSTKEVEKKIEKIENNLENLKKTYFSNLDKNILDHNKVKPINNILEKFNNVLKDIDPYAYLVRNNKEQFLRCEIFLKNCQNFLISNEELVNLLEGELVIDKRNYQYVGQNIDFNLLAKKNSENFKRFKNTQIFYEDGINIKVDEVNDIIQIDQIKIGSRIFFINGNLKDISIIFNGTKIQEDKIKNSFIPPNFPINNRGLTGCLSFINVEFNNINIKANNSSCEDTINFIKASGYVNNISIQNSFSDAFDADFSNLKIENLEITSAINDCTDFSAGVYELVNLKLSKCGDKAVSIGEKSNVKIKEINVSEADIGLAAKDSSILSLKNGYLSNLRTCVSAYNKKQEFNGGLVIIDNIKCNKFSNKFESDKLSKIIITQDLKISKK